MSNLINTNYALGNVNRSVSVSTPKQIRFRGDSGYENVLANEDVETKKKSAGKTVGIVTLVVLGLAAIGGIFCVRKGGKVLENKEATLKEKFIQGWKEFFGKSEKAAEEGKKAAEEAKNNVKENIAKKGEEIKPEVPKTENTNAVKAGDNAAKETANVVKENVVASPTKQDYDKFLKNFSKEERAIVEGQIEELNKMGIPAVFKETAEGNIIEIKATKEYASKLAEFGEKYAELYGVKIPAEESVEMKEQLLKMLNYKIKCNNFDEYMGSCMNEVIDRLSQCGI